MGTHAPVLLTYEQWAARPETNRIEELIDGELVVNPAPRAVHQDVVVRLTNRLGTFAEARGDRVLVAPFGLRTGPATVLEPDLVYFLTGRDTFDRNDHTVTVVPDLVVEVLSPSTRRHDLVRKRRHFAGHGIPEVWFVDVDALRIELATLADDGYETTLLEPGQQVVSQAVPDLALDVADILQPAID